MEMFKFIFGTVCSTVVGLVPATSFVTCSTNINTQNLHYEQFKLEDHQVRDMWTQMFSDKYVYIYQHGPFQYCKLEITYIIVIIMYYYCKQ